MNYWGRRRSAFRYAVQGLADSVRRETHMRIHVIAALAALAAGFLLDISAWQWLAISGCIVLVMICELVNTAIEKICDLVSGEAHPVIKYIKDISAGAVLLACLLAVITGLVVFMPRLMAIAG